MCKNEEKATDAEYSLKGATTFEFAGQSSGLEINYRIHSPLFIQTAIMIYINPASVKEMYENFVAANLKPQLELFDELISAGILERLPTGSVRVCGLAGLHMYVEAIRRIQLPRKTWVMP